MCVYRKLQECRVKLQSEPMKKSGNNKFAGYQYFELGDFLPTINRLFNEAGLFSRVSFTSELAALTIIDTEDKTDVVFTSPMGSAALKGCHEVQNIGACETYQRRYLYVTALEIVEHDALDSSEPVKKPSHPTVAKGAFEQMTTEEQDYLRGLRDSVVSSDNLRAAYEEAKKKLDADEQVAFWSLFDSKQRTAIKSPSVAATEKV